MPRRSYGFTLIELLVALVILALLSVAGYRGLDTVLQTRERVAEETRKWQHLTFFFSRLEQDVAQAIHRPARDQGGLAQPEWIGRGTGFASMQQLARMPFTELKIDQGFVTGCAQNHAAHVIVEASIALARGLGLKTVAEGIETEDATPCWTIKSIKNPHIGGFGGLLWTT